MLCDKLAFPLRFRTPLVISAGGLSLLLGLCGMAQAQVSQQYWECRQPSSGVEAGWCPTSTTNAIPVQGSLTPSGTQDVNQKQVNGATINVGAGVAGTGTQRVTTSTDSSTTAAQGAAASIAAGWPITDGEPADTSGTFTNGTQSGNVTTPSVDGYATAIISIHGTYSTATATFLASDDAGTTFYPLACTRIDGSNAPELGYTALSNTSRAWLCATQGFDEIQVLSSAVASGTVNVRISQSAAPVQAPAQQSVTQPTASLLNATVVGTGTFGTQSTTSPGARTLVTLDIKTVTTGGTAVAAISAGHRTAGGFLQNPVGATIALCINEIGTASGTTSSGDTTCIQPGQSYTVAPAAAAVSVITSDSSHPFSGYGLN